MGKAYMTLTPFPPYQSSHKNKFQRKRIYIKISSECSYPGWGNIKSKLSLPICLSVTLRDECDYITAKILEKCHSFISQNTASPWIYPASWRKCPQMSPSLHSNFKTNLYDKIHSLSSSPSLLEYLNCLKKMHQIIEENNQKYTKSVAFKTNLLYSFPSILRIHTSLITLHDIIIQANNSGANSYHLNKTFSLKVYT